ncbi:ubiquitin-like-conjugating enzyme ATG10 isoform X2 [Denticeps clupeoides]|uniref:ubiquitin-like-conjugating enzyme ATG10 isoform X2 n=1 Tax=Denticeps clupeoides TaxID=299321 RepID=UPI0010A30192|nr:ubiquitin-like-conjugating enzyme ATG10 isoform X2 [Denticeps clupeoides]
MSSDTDLAPVSCYLDEETFRLSCQLFIQHSSSIKDGWSWVQENASLEGYMTKTVVVAGKTALDHCRNGHSHLEHEADAMSVVEQQVDDEEEAPGQQLEADGHGVMRYEYHVLYSCSYQIPVLYFRASMLNVWNSVHPSYIKRLLQEPWDTITQQEHPLLGQPFFVLHPCRTEEFMRPALETAHAQRKKVNYIVTWLSVVGPVVGLDIPLSYATAVGAPSLPDLC